MELQTWVRLSNEQQQCLLPGKQSRGSLGESGCCLLFREEGLSLSSQGSLPDLSRLPPALQAFSTFRECGAWVSRSASLGQELFLFPSIPSRPLRVLVPAVSQSVHFAPFSPLPTLSRPQGSQQCPSWPHYGVQPSALSKTLLILWHLSLPDLCLPSSPLKRRKSRPPDMI